MINLLVFRVLSQICHLRGGGYSPNKFLLINVINAAFTRVDLILCIPPSSPSFPRYTTFISHIYLPTGFSPPVLVGAIPARPTAARPANGFFVNPDIWNGIYAPAQKQIEINH